MLKKKQTIVVVDDSLTISKYLMGNFMAAGYTVFAYNKPLYALQVIPSNRPDLIILDLTMPELDGFELCRRLKENESLKDIPVLFLSGTANKENVVHGFGLGAVDFVEKPIVFEVLLARVQTHLKLYQLQKEHIEENLKLENMVAEKVEKLHRAQLGTIVALAKLAEGRDTDTGAHLDRVQAYCELLARKMSVQPAYSDLISEWFITMIRYSSCLHDIGKVAIPDAILLKPGKLEPDEFSIMTNHAELGAKTLSIVLDEDPDNEFVRMGFDIAGGHHEKWDGSGYPLGTKGLEIPLCARIMAIADVYDALRAERCYKKGFSHEKSCDIITEGSGTHFDPSLVEIFLKNKDEFERIWDEFLEIQG